MRPQRAATTERTELADDLLHWQARLRQLNQVGLEQPPRNSSRIHLAEHRISPNRSRTFLLLIPPPMSHPVLRSIQVGLPRQLGVEGATHPMDRVWTTGFFKQAVPGPVRLRWTNLDGDGQADLVHHGGPDKAVLAYSIEHYPFLEQLLANDDLPFGAFGENFTISGLSEADVCIGDTWQVGSEAIVQVSQPRQPCWKLARRWRIKTLALQVQQTGRTGWYFRVLQEGVVAAGMPFQLIDRPYAAWTVARANHLMHIDKQDLSGAAGLAKLPLLAASWQATLRRRVEQLGTPDDRKRLVGPNEF